MSPTSEVLAGRYRLDGPIAAGAVGEVWRGRDLVLARPVAVKVLRSEYAGQPQTLARFRAEARHAASVSHPAIAQVYDYVEAGATEPPFLVMELIDGPSLADVLARGPLDPATSMDVLAQAAEGLQAAHAAGLVHRDVKPENLVINRSGRLKITDFGIAHAAGSAPITRIGMVMGTPAYLAPERVAGGPAEPASDLYSLGVVTYECLTGTPPFSGVPVEVAAAHQHRALPPLPASVPAGVARLVAELTAKDPAARLDSAGQAARQAARLRDSLTGGAASRLAAIAAGSFRSDRLAAHAGTLVDAHPVTWHDARPSGWAGYDRPRRRRGPLIAAAVAVVAGLAGWLIATAFPAAPGPGPAAPVSSSPAVQTVEVNSAALVGQKVSDVSQSLTQLGLTPTIVWTDNGQDPGTVISVDPSGPVPVGSTVTVTAQLQQKHDNGGGGNGGGG